MQIKEGEEGFWKTFKYFEVHEEWADELYNYFVHGFHPGSFHRAMFENDLRRAAQCSHVANQWQSIRDFMKWVNENAPNDSWGNRTNVTNWLALSDKKRRKLLEKHGWVLTEEELVWHMLNKNERLTTA